MGVFDFFDVVDQRKQRGALSSEQMATINGLKEIEDLVLKVTDSPDALKMDDENIWCQPIILKHLYRSRLGFAREICPKCGTMTKQQYVTLLYGGEREVRQCLTPSAWVCKPCQVVVIDEEAISDLNEAYSFKPLAIIEAAIHKKTETPKIPFFETYETKRPVYELDEDGYLTNILLDVNPLASFVSAEVEAKSAAKRKEHAVKKRKAQKRARRANRKRH